MQTCRSHRLPGKHLMLTNVKQALIENTHTHAHAPTHAHMHTRDSAGRLSLCCFRKTAGRQLIGVGGISHHHQKASSGKFGPQDWKGRLRGVREDTARNRGNILPRDASQLTIKPKALFRLLWSQRDCDGGRAQCCPPQCQQTLWTPGHARKGSCPHRPSSPADTPFTMSTRGCARKKTSFPGSQPFKKLLLV